MPPVKSAPLAGRRVLVTRAAHQAGKLSEGLRAAGFEPVEVPVLEIRPPLDFAPLDAALRQFSSYNWLIFTSANAVRAVVERAAALGISFDSGATPAVAAVGEATAIAARDTGFSVDAVPKDYVGESLAASLADRVAGKKILLARAEIAREVIPDVLCAAGAKVDVVNAYRNVLPENAAALLRAALEQGIDAATFTSSSSAAHLAEAACAAGVAFPFPGVPAVSIGPITSATLRELNWQPAVEASRSDIPGLIEAVRLALRNS